MYHLFLDDSRRVNHVTWENLPKGVPWTTVRTYDQFTSTVIKYGLPGFISFDHDLSKQQEAWYMDCVLKGWPEDAIRDELKRIYDTNTFTDRTGYHCARWLVNRCKEFQAKLPQYVVHSFNQAGKANIKELLEAYENTTNTTSE